MGVDQQVIAGWYVPLQVRGLGFKPEVVNDHHFLTQTHTQKKKTWVLNVNF